jgi:hypothetical protein
MTTATVTELVRNGNRVLHRADVGERVELARYTVPTAGERVIYGQRINGVVRLVDVPASGRGRSYLIERELERDGLSALQALTADYLAQAARLGDVPMAVSPLDRFLEHLP